MDALKAIRKRRSVRRFLDRKIEEEKTSMVLEAASLAPSSGNVQNWDFIIVKGNKEIISKACKQNFLLEAPVLVVVCNLRDKVGNLFDEKGKDFYSVQNCALAIENMLIAATALGLGSCFTAVFNEEMMKRALNVPENVSIDAVIALGYSDEKNEAKRTKISLKTFFESYGNRRKKGIFPFFRK